MLVINEVEHLLNVFFVFCRMSFQVFHPFFSNGCLCHCVTAVCIYFGCWGFASWKYLFPFHGVLPLFCPRWLSLNSFVYPSGASGNSLSLRGLPFSCLLEFLAAQPHSLLPVQRQAAQTVSKPPWEKQCEPCAVRACFVFSSLLPSSISRENRVWAVSHHVNIYCAHQCWKE